VLGLARPDQIIRPSICVVISAARSARVSAAIFGLRSAIMPSIESRSRP
jgi:hypothetical protein